MHIHQSENFVTKMEKWGHLCLMDTFLILFISHKFGVNCLYNMSCLFLGRPIFSIDIHPDGSRFATGGQGL